MRFLLPFFLILGFYLNGCGGGLDPTTLPATARIYGTVTFIGGTANWPPMDSLQDLRVAAFREIPTSVQEVLGNIISGTAFSSSTLGLDVVSSNYYIDIPTPPLDLKYIVVAQRYGPNITQDWQVVGIYTKDYVNLTPTSLSINEGQVYSNINIHVDFHKLPPQPFTK